MVIGDGCTGLPEHARATYTLVSSSPVVNPLVAPGLVPVDLVEWLKKNKGKRKSKSVRGKRKRKLIDIRRQIRKKPRRKQAVEKEEAKQSKEAELAFGTREAWFTA